MMKFIVSVASVFFLFQGMALGSEDDLAPPSIESQELAVQEKDAADTHEMAEALTNQELDKPGASQSEATREAASAPVPYPEINNTKAADREAALWGSGDDSSRKHKSKYRLSKNHKKHSKQKIAHHKKKSTKVAHHKKKSTKVAKHKKAHPKFATILPKKKMATSRHIASTVH